MIADLKRSLDIADPSSIRVSDVSNKFLDLAFGAVTILSFLPKQACKLWHD